VQMTAAPRGQITKPPKPAGSSAAQFSSAQPHAIRFPGLGQDSNGKTGIKQGKVARPWD